MSKKKTTARVLASKLGMNTGQVEVCQESIEDIQARVDKLKDILDVMVLIQNQGYLDYEIGNRAIGGIYLDLCRNKAQLKRRKKEK